ncbi:hypothetical protein BH11BAC6_BH11BAC6_13700 [soil metagenome]
MVKAIKSFVRFTNSLLITFCEFVLEGVAANATLFAVPLPTIASIQTTLDAFDAAVLAAETRERVKITARNQLRKQLLAEMRQLCDYVNTIAQGNANTVAASNFDPSKQRAPRHIAAPAAPKVTQGINPGDIDSKCPAVAGAVSYLHQVLAENAPAGTEWTSFSSSRSQYTFTKLQRGVVYRIRVVVTGSNGQVVYSPESVQTPAV